MASAARRADERAAEAVGFGVAAHVLWAAYADQLKPSMSARAIEQMARTAERAAGAAIAEAAAIRTALASPELAAGSAVEVALDEHPTPSPAH